MVRRCAARYCGKSGSQHLLLWAKTRVLRHDSGVFKAFDCLKTHDTFKIRNESLPDYLPGHSLQGASESALRNIATWGVFEEQDS